MGLFKKEQFNQAVQTGGFKDIPSCHGVFELERCNIKKTNNGAVMIAFGWSIVPGENEENEGAWFFENQTLINADGTQNDIGVAWLNKRLMQLSEGTWEYAHFDDNEEANLARFEGTKIRGKVTNKPSKNPEYPQPTYTVSIKAIMENKYNQGSKSQNQSAPPQQNTPPQTTAPNQEVEEDGATVKVGYEIKFVKDGLPTTGLVHQINDELNMLQVLLRDGNIIAVHFADCESIVRESVPDGEYVPSSKKEVKDDVEELDVDLDMDEDSEPTLGVGATVKFTYAKQERLGVVKEMLEDEGKAKVQFSFNGKTVAGKIAIDKLELVTPK